MSTAAVLLIACIALIALVKWLKPQLAAARADQASSGHMFMWPASGSYDIDVVGESFYMDALSSLLGSNREVKVVAVLVPYSHTKDSNAVRVEIKGKIVGHLARDQAPEFRRLLAAKHKALATTSCKAVVGGGATKQDGTKGPIGVRLDIANL